MLRNKLSGPAVVEIFFDIDASTKVGEGPRAFVDSDKLLRKPRIRFAARVCTAIAFVCAGEKELVYGRLGVGSWATAVALPEHRWEKVRGKRFGKVGQKPSTSPGSATGAAAAWCHASVKS